MENKWIKDSFEEYKNVDALNSSSIKLLLRSPAHYRALKDIPNDTAASNFGTLLHMCILEPEQMKNIVFEPEGDKRSSKFREQLEIWRASLHEDAIIVTEKEFNEITHILSAINNHSICYDLINDGITERSGYIYDPQYDIRIKIRPDILKGNTIVDIKTTKNASYDSFQKDIFNYGYDIQAAFYTFYANNLSRELGNGPVDQFIWIAIEKEPPYGIAIYFADSNILRTGGTKCLNAIKKYSLCKKNDKWPMYHDLPVVMMAPSWIKENN